MLLPIDTVVSEDPHNPKPEVTAIDSIAEAKKGLDIGPQTCNLFNSEIEKAKTIVWNGPLGMFEVPAFSSGTNSIARKVAEATQKGAVSIIGGGGTTAGVFIGGFVEKVRTILT